MIFLFDNFRLPNAGIIQLTYTILNILERQPYRGADARSLDNTHTRPIKYIIYMRLYTGHGSRNRPLWPRTYIRRPRASGVYSQRPTVGY